MASLQKHLINFKRGILFKKQVQNIRIILAFSKYILSSPTQRKYLFPWLVSLRPNYLILASSPWLCFDSITYIHKWIGVKKNLKIFEYGSGGSTIFWSKYCSELVSIEHDPSWYKIIQKYIDNNPKIDYRMIECERNNEFVLKPDLADPLQYFSSADLSGFCYFRNYVNQIDTFPNGYFDIVSIDGRARPACIAHAVEKVKLGGLLILDNADIPYYLEKTKGYLVGYNEHIYLGVTPTSNWFTQTNIYERIW